MRKQGRVGRNYLGRAKGSFKMTSEVEVRQAASEKDGKKNGNNLPRKPEKPKQEMKCNQ